MEQRGLFACTGGLIAFSSDSSLEKPLFHLRRRKSICPALIFLGVLAVRVSNSDAYKRAVPSVEHDC